MIMTQEYSIRKARATHECWYRNVFHYKNTTQIFHLCSPLREQYANVVFVVRVDICVLFPLREQDTNAAFVMFFVTRTIYKCSICDVLIRTFFFLLEEHTNVAFVMPFVVRTANKCCIRDCLARTTQMLHSWNSYENNKFLHLWCSAFLEQHTNSQ